MERISNRQVSFVDVHYHKWATTDGIGGFNVDCTETGEVTAEHAEDFAKFRADETAGKLIYCGVVTYTRKEVKAAIIKCNCGQEVYLHGFTNTCECGASRREINGARKLASTTVTANRTPKDYFVIVPMRRQTCAQVMERTTDNVYGLAIRQLWVPVYDQTISDQVLRQVRRMIADGQTE
jgi:hypothetical protein